MADRPIQPGQPTPPHSPLRRGASLRRGSPVLWGILSAIALVFLVWFIWSLFDRREPEVTGVTIEQVVADPQAYQGEIVTLRGVVVDTVGPASFTLQEQHGVTGASVLVVSGTGRMFPIDAGAVTGVTGRVDVFDRARMERDLGYHLDEQAYFAWQGRPVIVASEVRRLDAPQDPGGT